MTCFLYEKYGLGKIDEEAYKNHVKTCPVCQEILSADEQLLNLAKSEETSSLSPWLWTRIETQLSEEKAEQKSLRYARWMKAVPVLRVAAVLAIGIVVGVVFFGSPRDNASKLLGDSALKKVERSEQAYMEAIADLEEKVQPMMAQMDVELMLLYRDRLETIDSQIERCREALEENPANAHIRRYMLAALKDKKQTLRELLSSHG